MLLGGATILAAAPTQAQTYDPRYPVCMQVYSREGSFIGCGFTSMAQCAASASGRAAQCLANPYFARTDKKAARRAYRRRQGLNQGGAPSPLRRDAQLGLGADARLISSEARTVPDMKHEDLTLVQLSQCTIIGPTR